MAAFASLVKSAGIVGAKGPANVIGSIFDGKIANVARIASNMRSAQFTEEEIMRLVKALYLSEAKQDARDAWAVLDRRKIGSVSRAELEETLTDIFGSDDRRRIRHLLDRLPSRAAAFAHSAEQRTDDESTFAADPTDKEEAGGLSARGGRRLTAHPAHFMMIEIHPE